MKQKTIVVVVETSTYLDTNVAQTGETAVVTVAVNRIDHVRGYRADIVMIPRKYYGMENVRAMALALTDDTKGSIQYY